ncbi:PDCD2_C domain-containing protein [Aulographum hederae CBS 113979]|uniref:PDCD2_C domain-containing protein n=1 Tax=Aulographum hederae CBS 113979 TaxID=1176131 RepID=A0A6G1H4J6_9PEZI|nr:PDCD2_C domain-containing protein [Aulographum hederae CBS 113979]
MSPQNDYDSDSSLSDADAVSYTTTNTMLGYASREPTEDPLSQLGGRPTWISSTTPSSALARCKVCKKLMPLLLMLDGNLPEQFPGHERRLYVFACRGKGCRRKAGSVRGVRGARISKIAEPKAKENVKASEEVQKEEKGKQNTDIGAALFGVAPGHAAAKNTNPFSMNTSTFNGNPFSASTGENQNNSLVTSDLAAKPPQKIEPTQNDMSNLTETFASKAKISNPSTPPPPQRDLVPREPWPSDDGLPPPYTKYHLEAYSEQLDKEPLAVPQNARIMDLDTAEPSSGAERGEDKELFESSMDKQFQKFADRVAQNPEQVLRYEYGGNPLLYSDHDATALCFVAPASRNANTKVTTVNRPDGKGKGMPRCENCGAERVFELQLTPHAIAVLEEDEDVGLDGMDWGTIVLGVCGRDCVERGVAEGEVSYLEEWIGVQWEELGGPVR